MRRHRSDNQRIALPLIQIFLRVGQRFAGSLIVGRGKIDDGLSQDTAHSRIFGYARHDILEIIHIRVRGDAAAQHLEHSEFGPPIDKIRSHVARFRRENILLKPFVEREVVGQSAKQAHRGVGVTVNQPRHHERAMRINRLRGFESALDFRTRAYGDNRIAANGYRAVFNHSPLRVHGDDSSTGNQQIHFVFGGCC